MKHQIRTLILLIAAGLVVFGALEIGLEYAHHVVQLRRHIEPVETNVWHYIIGTLLMVLGIILFAISTRLAEQLTDDFDE